jgi:hypothetical protein
MAVYSPSGSGSVHVDLVLTNISIQWPMDMGFVGPELFPMVPVAKQSNKYYIYDREFFKVEAADVRAPGTVANEIPGLKVSTDSYYANEHALQIAVTDEERQNADVPLSPDQDAVELITERIVLSRELNMMNMARTIGNYASGNSVTLAGGNQWNSANYATSNPISDIKTGVRAINAKIFKNPNLAIFPYQVMTQLEDHPDFIERIKYSERAILTPEIISSVLGIERVLVPGVGYSTAAAGVSVSSANMTYMWGKDVILAYVPGKPGIKQLGFGYEFVWGYGGGQARDNGKGAGSSQSQIIDRWREDPRASDIIRCRRRYDLKLVGIEGNLLITGYLIQAAVA